MNVTLDPSEGNSAVLVEITGSKSETNRLLILQALFPGIRIENASESDDSRVLVKALSSTSGRIDVHHAGTAMRFLTAYFATQEDREVVLTGSDRMQQRPIGVLVDALRQLGAEISYTNEEGFPPLKIQGKKLTHNHVTLKADISSQYISALLLVAPSLTNGLQLDLQGTITSRPYIEMTLSLLEQLGVAANFRGNSIEVQPLEAARNQVITVESDWSSASYFYSLVAISECMEVTLRSYKRQSLQGDAALIVLYEKLGVFTSFSSGDNSITLKKGATEIPEHFSADLSSTPDIAQTIAVTCFGLGIGCTLTGLHTLKIKETDRLHALKVELEKLGAVVGITEDSLSLATAQTIEEHVTIHTYQDHRMAMAFAPLALKVPLRVKDADVVSKSYPTFWDDMEKAGLRVRYER